VARRLVIDQPRRPIRLSPRLLEVTKTVIAADREGSVELAPIIGCRVELSRLPQSFSYPLRRVLQYGRLQAVRRAKSWPRPQMPVFVGGPNILANQHPAD
jgi:hypothetical protein